MARRDSTFLVVGVLVAILLGAATFYTATQFNSSAKAADDGAWTMIGFHDDCTRYDDICDTGSGRWEGEVTTSSGLQGDSNGDLSILPNFLSKLEVDGCEWQMLPPASHVDFRVLYRC